MEGIFNLYYDMSPNDDRALLASWFLGLDEQAQSDFLPFPTPPKGLKGYALLFEGTLGLESGAIAGRVFDPVPGAYVFALGMGRVSDGTVVEDRTLGVVEQPVPVAGAELFGGHFRVAQGSSTEEGVWKGHLYRALYESPGNRLRVVAALPNASGCFTWDGEPQQGLPQVYVGPAEIEIYAAETPDERHGPGGVHVLVATRHGPQAGDGGGERRDGALRGEDRRCSVPLGPGEDRAAIPDSATASQADERLWCHVAGRGRAVACPRKRSLRPRG